MKIRQTIYADEGKVLTNGEIYGNIIHLADGANVEDYHEITDEEYSEIMRAQEESNRPENI